MGENFSRLTDRMKERRLIKRARDRVYDAGVRMNDAFVAHGKNSPQFKEASKDMNTLLTEWKDRVYEYGGTTPPVDTKDLVWFYEDERFSGLLRKNGFITG